MEAFLGHLIHFALWVFFVIFVFAVIGVIATIRWILGLITGTETAVEDVIHRR